ncbi:phosphatidylinositol 4,5-bisphosphate 5-phosphatase A-like isoform X2 [Eupeodes corollae]|uniref:phosphatidylinositol 4,5-bisphosphate 5-phosphatase A-like isoform X2 n=1 Tax=Eupeodes corollae TaxID=290404 RepID=UPI0024910C8C|nr:phosphatidylinositol 4,5-bisphosphate 5-phosphatase A-like isoform X2 [Eupeodes corollae]
MNKTTPWNFNVYIITWNVGTKYPDDLSLYNLLGLKSHTCPGESLPDLYAIGLQEVNSRPKNQVLGLFKDDPWTIGFKEILKDHDYVAIKTEQMQGLMLTLFSKRKHVPHLRSIEAEFTRTGFGGIWGNKGAVSIRLSVYGCGVSFVVAHLAAHDHELDERIEDYRQILENHHYHVKKYREIFDHEYVFWFGDLNFRLTGDDSPEEVRSLVEQDKLSQLIQRDQLLLVRENRKAFHQLQEKLPEFPPTFKFKENTSSYDMKRRPAWTDRILYTINRDKYPDIKLHLEQRSYKSHPGYTISDHRPVSSEFIIKLPKARSLIQNQMPMAAKQRMVNLELYTKFDETDYSDEHEQVTTDPNELFVEFRDVPIWMIGEENTVEYYKPHGFVEEDNDWIGVYPSNYASFSDYAAYQYVNQADTPSTPAAAGGLEPHYHHRAKPINPTTMRIPFSEDIELKDGENYMLIYFQNTGIRGVTSVAGMSNTFRAEKRPPTPRFEMLD